MDGDAEMGDEWMGMQGWVHPGVLRGVGDAMSAWRIPKTGSAVSQPDVTVTPAQR